MSELPSQSTDFPSWYADVVRRADLAEHAPVRGTMVIKPYGYAIWELIQRAVDDRIRATGHQNLSFPMLMPVSLLEREAELVEGFSPEIAVVTRAGGNELEEPLALRPTSEALFWSTYARWIQSYRDLPLLYNQWANVVRWELRPRLFLRTSEFLWQEGHTAHETAEEALAEALMVLRDVFADVAENVLGIPVLRGRKTAAERFPGAVETFTIEAMMRDRKALQAGTSHYLGDDFARAYGVRFTGRDGAEHHPFATSWGVSTRLVGGLIMAHGDDRGLRLPPAVAPHQVVVIPITGREPDAGVSEAFAELARELRAAGVRVLADDRDHVRPGARFAEWEVKGVPVRVELGRRDLDAGVVSVVPRMGGAREQVARAGLAERVGQLLGESQAGLLAEAAAFRAASTREFADGGELCEFLAAGEGFAVGSWCGSARCEALVKTQTAATIRCLPIDAERPGRPCVVCGEVGTESATWAQSY